MRRWNQAFQQGLESYHLYLYRTSEGTQPAYLFIEIQVNASRRRSRLFKLWLRRTQLLVQNGSPGGAPERRRAPDASTNRGRGRRVPDFGRTTPPSSSAGKVTAGELLHPARDFLGFHRSCVRTRGPLLTCLFVCLSALTTAAGRVGPLVVPGPAPGAERKYRQEREEAVKAALPPSEASRFRGLRFYPFDPRTGFEP